MISGNKTRFENIPNIMTTHFYMFRAFMKHRILSNVETGLTITIKIHRARMSNAKTLKQGLKPNQLTSGSGHKAILNFNGRLRDNVLLLSFPRNRKMTKKNEPTSQRMPSKRATGPIKITPTSQLKITIGTKKNSLLGTPL